MILVLFFRIKQFYWELGSLLHTLSDVYTALEGPAKQAAREKTEWAYILHQSRRVLCDQDKALQSGLEQNMGKSRFMRWGFKSKDLVRWGRPSPISTEVY